MNQISFEKWWIHVQLVGDRDRCYPLQPRRWRSSNVYLICELRPWRLAGSIQPIFHGCSMNLERLKAIRLIANPASTSWPENAEDFGHGDFTRRRALNGSCAKKGGNECQISCEHWDYERKIWLQDLSGIHRVMYNGFYHSNFYVSDFPSNSMFAVGLSRN